MYLVYDAENKRMAVEKHLVGELEFYQKLSELEHPYLPKIYKAYFRDGETHILEEYIEGGSIITINADERQISKWFLELCDVLSFLHSKGIIHRDIKPSNILLGKDGHIRLIDFDAAREEKESADSDTRPLGTRGYAPPEQYGFSQTDVRADIYSLGVTLKELLGEKADKTIYRRIIKKCTEFTPKKRFTNVNALKKAWKTRQFRSLLPYILCTVLLIAVIFVYIWYQSNKAAITKARYPDEDLLFYATQGDYIIAKAEDLRQSGQQVTLDVDINEDGHIEQLQLYADINGTILADLTTGQPVTVDGVYGGAEFINYLEMDLPLPYFLSPEDWEYQIEQEDSWKTRKISDDTYIQISCLDLDPYSKNGKELLISIGNMDTYLVTGVYAYDETNPSIADYRGFMWGSTNMKQETAGSIAAELLINPYGGFNTYVYTNGKISGEFNTVDFEKYHEALNGELSLKEWHNEFSSREAIKGR